MKGIWIFAGLLQAAPRLTIFQADFSSSLPQAFIIISVVNFAVTMYLLRYPIVDSIILVMVLRLDLKQYSGIQVECFRSLLLIDDCLCCPKSGPMEANCIFVLFCFVFDFLYLGQHSIEFYETVFPPDVF